MCGIFGYTGAPRDVAGMVFAGLKELEYRGYDSWGIAVGVDHAARSAHGVGKLGKDAPELPSSGLALGHTRWATTGAVTQANAHPHSDCTGRVALVHNGIIENYEELRAGLLARGHSFKSQTDTEVAAHLLEEELAAMPVGTEGALAEALRRANLKLTGLNALAAFDTLTGELAAVKNGSPLIVGLNCGGNYLASDQAALLAHTDRLIFVRDGQVAALWPDKVKMLDASTGDDMPLEIEQVQWRPEQAGLNGYAHYMEKEIWEQPGMLRHIAAHGNEQAAGLARFISNANRLYLTGCGTAYHAALSGSYMLATQARRAVTAAYPHEHPAFAPLLGAGDSILALSQSGETIDVLDAVRAARANGASVGALVNVPGSTLAREADERWMLGSGPEKSVLSTKTFTAKLSYLLMATGILAGDPLAAAGALNTAADEIEGLESDAHGTLTALRDVARRIAPRDHLFLLGKGLGYPMALEGALKIKEVSYIHAEGFAAGELKHGVIALIEPGTPVLVYAPEGAEEAHMLTAAGEVKARGAYVVGIGPNNHTVFDAHLPVASGGMAFYFTATVLMQRLAYELALLRDTDPDKPRNLAKSVTVR